jgi:hypothetical protein
MIGSVLLGILWWGFARSGRNAPIAGGVLALALLLYRHPAIAG